MVPVIWLVVLAIQDCVVVETTGVTTRGFKIWSMVVSVENMKLLATGFAWMLGETVTTE